MSESAKRRCLDPKWIAAQHARGVQLPTDSVRKMYESGMTQSEIAAVFGTTQKVVFRFMKNNGIHARKAFKRNQTMKSNSYWRGGRYIDDAGYIRVKQDGHPRAKKCGGYVFEHILVAESVIGRYIQRNECVHHINGNKSDNDPNNLAVMSASEHIRYHSRLRHGLPVTEPIAVTKAHFPEADEERND